MTSVLEELAAANIQLIPVADIGNHFLFERAGCAALVQRRDGGFGQVGAPGALTEQGFAVLMWSGGDAVFRGKGFETPASAEQVAAVRAFAADLAAALSRPAFLL